MDCYRLWLSVGRPEDGDIFLRMKQAKADYKKALNDCKVAKECQIGDGLYDALMDKDKNSFWRSWKCKFGKKDSRSKIIEGSRKKDDIASIFKQFF